MTDDRRNVPCNGCTACCKTQKAPLFPEYGDQTSRYLTEPTVMKDGTKRRMLKRKDNGECHYLGDSGCTIHDRVPWVCRRFDCRRLALGFGDAAIMREVWGVADNVVRAGFSRLHTLGFVAPARTDEPQTVAATVSAGRDT